MLSQRYRWKRRIYKHGLIRTEIYDTATGELVAWHETDGHAFRLWLKRAKYQNLEVENITLGLNASRPFFSCDLQDLLRTYNVPEDLAETIMRTAFKALYLVKLFFRGQR